ncbi:MAG: DUF4321 domain-containing protein [Armatimonadota bacterium]|nr:DUF4321 domain-containing protein [Armatimonadota bacterium]MDR5698095.1 DUF4321 domain-containing protein [Armatimonadota bacterium]
MTRRSHRPWLALVFVVLTGGLVGHVLAQAVGTLPGLAFLSRTVEPGLDPSLHIDAGLVTLTFGFTVRLNLAVLIGVLIALWVWRAVL